MTGPTREVALGVVGRNSNDGRSERRDWARHLNPSLNESVQEEEAVEVEAKQR